MSLLHHFETHVKLSVNQPAITTDLCRTLHGVAPGHPKVVIITAIGFASVGGRSVEPCFHVSIAGADTAIVHVKSVKTIPDVAKKLRQFIRDNFTRTESKSLLEGMLSMPPERRKKKGKKTKKRLPATTEDLKSELSKQRASLKRLSDMEKRILARQRKLVASISKMFDRLMDLTTGASK